MPVCTICATDDRMSVTKSDPFNCITVADSLLKLGTCELLFIKATFNFPSYSPMYWGLLDFLYQRHKT